MRYRNIVTGEELNLSSRISAPNYVLVDEVKVYEPKTSVKPQEPKEVKEDVKEVPKRKRSAKK